MDNNGFVYIFSNTEYVGLIKIGKSKSNPVIRADQLSKNTGAIGTFVLEWSKEVPAMDIAEIFLHFIFRNFHYQKEFFKIGVQDAKSIAATTLDSFFAIDAKTQLSWKPREKETGIKPDLSELEKEAIELEKELKKI